MLASLPKQHIPKGPVALFIRPEVKGGMNVDKMAAHQAFGSGVITRLQRVDQCPMRMAGTCQRL